MNYKTEVLDYLVKYKIKLKTKFFRNILDETIFCDHLIEYLVLLSFSINLNSIDFQRNDIVGYICYYDPDQK